MPYYDLCCRYHGRNVRINDRYGKTHIGRINRVTRNHVYIEPLGRSGRYRGFGYGYGGYGGYGYGYGYPIAFAAISALALAAVFW